MEILTHCIISAFYIEAIFRWRDRQGWTTGPERTRAFWIAGLAAGLGPDIERLLVAPITGGRLGALAHYHGYVHTLLGVGVVAAAVTGGIYLYFRRQGIRLARRYWYSIGAVALGAAGLHLVTDAFTNFGMHPLWPFSDRWFFGDTLAFMEPWVWMLLLPPLFLQGSHPALRYGAAALFTGGLVTVWFSSVYPWYISLLLTLSGLSLWKAIRSLSGFGRVASSAVALGLVMSFFLGFSRSLKADFREGYWLEEGNLELHDVILSAMPGNPFCWWLVTVEAEEDRSRFLMRVGVMAPIPSVVPPRQCPFPAQTTAQLQPPSESGRSDILWMGEYRGVPREIAALGQEHCQVGAFLRFARAPYVREAAGDWIVGDLRYDREGGLSFAELQVAQRPRRCPSAVPSWRSPRERLFSPSPE